MTDNGEGFFHNKDALLGTALILTLMSFFLINWGVRDGDWIYWIGSALLVIGFLLAPLSKFTAGGREPEEAGKEEGQ